MMTNPGCHKSKRSTFYFGLHPRRVSDHLRIAFFFFGEKTPAYVPATPRSGLENVGRFSD
jgi:hypothetical protein